MEKVLANVSDKIVIDTKIEGVLPFLNVDKNGDPRKMKKLFPSFLAVFVVVIFNSIFITNEAQQAIVTQFGRPVGDPIIDAGLKFKIPFIQKVIMFDKRILEWDGAANEIPTKDDKYIFIDTFARWRISDPLLFLKLQRMKEMLNLDLMM